MRRPESLIIQRVYLLDTQMNMANLCKLVAEGKTSHPAALPGSIAPGKVIVKLFPQLVSTVPPRSMVFAAVIFGLQAGEDVN